MESAWCWRNLEKQTVYATEATAVGGHQLNKPRAATSSWVTDTAAQCIGRAAEVRRIDMVNDAGELTAVSRITVAVLSAPKRRDLRRGPAGPPSPSKARGPGRSAGTVTCAMPPGAAIESCALNGLVSLVPARRNGFAARTSARAARALFTAAALWRTSETAFPHRGAWRRWLCALTCQSADHVPGGSVRWRWMLQPGVDWSCRPEGARKTGHGRPRSPGTETRRERRWWKFFMIEVHRF